MIGYLVQKSLTRIINRLHVMLVKGVRSPNQMNSKIIHVLATRLVGRPAGRGRSSDIYKQMLNDKKSVRIYDNIINNLLGQKSRTCEPLESIVGTLAFWFIFASAFTSIHVANK